MPLTAKHRTSLYQALAPIVGTEEAEALLNEYPGSEVDQLATVGDLRAGHAEVRTEIAEVRAEIAEVRADLTAKIGEVRADLTEKIVGVHADLTEKIGEVRTEVAELRGEVRAEVGTVRTEVQELRADLYQVVHRQTVWMASVLFGGMALIASIATAIANG